MSTKATIVYEKDFHIFEECFTDDIYLEVSGKELDFRVSPDYVMVRLPAGFMKKMEEHFRKKPKNARKVNKLQFPKKIALDCSFEDLQKAMIKARKKIDAAEKKK